MSIDKEISNNGHISYIKSEINLDSETISQNLKEEIKEKLESLYEYCDNPDQVMITYEIQVERYKL